jgi:hypothetical protein
MQAGARLAAAEASMSDLFPLSVLEQAGERLIRADLGLGGSELPCGMTSDKRRKRLESIRLEAQLRASVDLDGTYRVSAAMAYLLRALEAVCEMDTSPGTRQGTHLLDARFYLREASKSVLATVREREKQGEWVA